MDSNGGERPSSPSLSQQGGGAGGSLTRVTPARVASGPDKAGTCQYCQMVRVRRAGWKGVRKESAFTSLKARTGPNLADMGRERCAPARTGGELLWPAFNDWSGDHGEVLRGSCGDAAGTESGSSSIERITVNTGTVPAYPPVAHPVRLVGLGASTADRSGTGRSPVVLRAGESPCTWGRAAAVSRREGGCNAARRAAEWQRS